MKAKQNIDDQDWELLAKSIYDENPDASAEILALSGNDSLLKEKDQILEMVEKIDLSFDLRIYPAEKAWNKVHSRIHKPSNTNPIRFRTLISNPLFRMAAAAVFAALILLSGYEVFYSPSEHKKLIEISAANQVLKSFILPDGTEVSLNTDTKIEYPEQFAGNTREVTIEGEAFFQVKPNKDHPFIIHAGNAQIKVLGTSFNVNAYPATKLVEVIVETGRVQVYRETSATHELILTPGEKGTLVDSANSFLKSTNQDPNFIAWKTRNLIFQATSLSEVVENLEKVYNVTIRLADPKLNELLLTAQFNDYSLEFILKVIETTFQLEAKQVDGLYIIQARS